MFEGGAPPATPSLPTPSTVRRMQPQDVRTISVAHVRTIAMIGRPDDLGGNRAERSATGGERDRQEVSENAIKETSCVYERQLVTRACVRACVSERVCPCFFTG